MASASEEREWRARVRRGDEVFVTSPGIAYRGGDGTFLKLSRRGRGNGALYVIVDERELRFSVETGRQVTREERPRHLLKPTAYHREMAEHLALRQLISREGAEFWDGLPLERLRLVAEILFPSGRMSIIAPEHMGTVSAALSTLFKTEDWGSISSQLRERVKLARGRKVRLQRGEPSVQRLTAQVESQARRIRALEKAMPAEILRGLNNPKE